MVKKSSSSIPLYCHYRFCWQTATGIQIETGCQNSICKYRDVHNIQNQHRCSSINKNYKKKFDPEDEGTTIHQNTGK
jgi:hypothetical protein